MTGAATATDWLLDADPSIRWQVMRDLLDAPEREWRAARAKAETEGWGARLLSHEDEDGQWAGGAFVPRGFGPGKWQQEGQPWTATTFALTQLREFGLDPASDRARRAVALIGENSRWEHDGQPFWEGEVEECINGRTVSGGAYFGVDVGPIVDRLVGERLDDGGWNCERANGSVRSSFATTINVLEGLLEYERATGGTPESRAARASGEELLLERNLFRRLGTGEPADERFLSLVQSELVALRRPPGASPLPLRRGPDRRRTGPETGRGGRPRPLKALGRRHVASGLRRVWFEVDDGRGEPSRWLTLRALRVLEWWDREDATQQRTGP
jgi:hypothetical protein